MLPRWVTKRKFAEAKQPDREPTVVVRIKPSRLHVRAELTQETRGTIPPWVLDFDQRTVPVHACALPKRTHGRKRPQVVRWHCFTCDQRWELQTGANWVQVSGPATDQWSRMR